MGEIAGLMTAVCWAVGSVIFSRVRLPAAAINLFKNIVSGVALVVTVLLVAGGFETDRVALLWLGASGVVGIVIGDTCHFRAIQVLGPRRSVVLETLAPPLSALFGWFLLDERLGAAAVAGMAVTLLGIVLVLRDRTPSVGNLDLDTHPAHGVMFGLSAALCQALGAALSKVGIRQLERVSEDSSSASLEATCWRLIVAATVGLLLAIAGRRLAPWWRAWRQPAILKMGIPASLIGTYAGIWLSMFAFQHTEVAVASTLTALSPVVVLPLVAIYLKEKITRRAAAGAVLAVVGVAILAGR